jgi:GTPase-associated protein 1, N-terminal domain type 2/GTPase-associated protein 1, middle domain
VIVTRHLIEQQYYTRGRQGIFRSNEGYDTVAKSPRLDNSFIKKTLHPFCVYDAPRELQEREADPREYPDALICFRAETGELVIGQSVYAGADFTGQRNTFFSHNYVIPALRRDEFCLRPRKIFGIEGFDRKHDETAGKDLPSLEDIPYREGDPGDRKRALARLGVDERTFKQLLYAVMMSLSAKKKVFVSLDGEVGAAAASARELMEILYGCLPYEMRRHIGFLTYSNEPQSKKHINVMFVQKGSIRPGAGHIDKEFLFDLPNKRIWNADLQEGEHEYLDFAWMYLNEPRVLADFYQFAEEVLAGDESGAGLRLATYYELCPLFLIEKGRMAVYEKNRAAVWQVILNYVENGQLKNKKRLQELLVGLFREEKAAVAARVLPAGELVRLIIQSGRVVEPRSKQKEMVLYLMDVLLKGRLMQPGKYLGEVYKHLAAEPEMFSLVMSTALRHEQFVKPLFEEYLAKRLEAALRIEDVLKEIGFWAEHAPEALRNPFFKEATRNKLLAQFRGSGQKTDAASQIHRFFRKSRESSDYARETLDEIDRCLLKYVNLETLSREDFEGIVELLEDKPQTFARELDLESRETYDLLMNLAALEQAEVIPPPEEFFRSFDPDEIDKQQRLLRRLLGEKLDQRSFPMVWLAFYQADSQSIHDTPYDRMLSFVHEKGGEESVYPFVQWTITERSFFHGKALAPGYRAALKRYFLEDKGQRLRDKAWRKKWYAVRNADFRRVLDEVRNESSNGLVRLFRRHTGIMVIGTALLVAGGSVGGVMLYTSKQTTPATGEAGHPASGGGTGNPGTGVSVPGSGEASNPPVRIYGPMLPAGNGTPAGDAGNAGNTGDAGNGGSTTGNSGSTGSAGNSGNAENTGNTGNTENTNSPGDTGKTGSADTTKDESNAGSSGTGENGPNTSPTPKTGDGQSSPSPP